MDSVNALRIYHNLTDAYQSGEESVIGEENIVKIDMTSFSRTNEVSLSVIYGVENKSSKVHGHEVEVHALDTLDLVVNVDLSIERERPGCEVDPTHHVDEYLLPLLHQNL